VVSVRHLGLELKGLNLLEPLSLGVLASWILKKLKRTWLNVKLRNEWDLNPLKRVGQEHL
jgi:hypothetical protein